MTHRITRPGLLALWVFNLAAAELFAADDVVYGNNFNGPVNSSFDEWSSLPIVYFNGSTPRKGTKLEAPKVVTSESPNRKQRYLGPFGGPRLAENTKHFNRTRARADDSAQAREAARSQIGHRFL